MLEDWTLYYKESGISDISKEKIKILNYGNDMVKYLINLNKNLDNKVNQIDGINITKSGYALNFWE